MIQGYIKQARERCWKLYDHYYPSGTYKNHNARYREAIRMHLTGKTCLLDAGCGSSMWFTREVWKDTSMAVGVDIGEVRSFVPGPLAVRSDLHRLPFKDASFDVVISMSVLEHISNPAMLFSEVARVLRPKGVVIFQTPNSHDYVSLIAKCTPFWFHQWILARLGMRDEEDTFPTFFRANTGKQISSYLQSNGFESVDITLFNQYPAYLMFSSMLFRAGVLYERLTSRYEMLAPLRGWILAVARKRG